MAETVQLDALPYADGGYDDPAVRSAVLCIIDLLFNKFDQVAAMIEEEKKQHQPHLHSYLAHLPLPSGTHLEVFIHHFDLTRLT